LELVEDKFYLIDKQSTWTSFDVVKKMKFMAKFKKIGHAGTLDPLATGLLIICVGKYTKKIEFFQSLPKVYTGTFVLGKTTPSIDLETPFDETDWPINQITLEKLDLVRNSFLGNIIQTPPIYSAVKQNGKRLFVHARKGVQEADLAIKSREVEVYEFEISTNRFPEIDFKIKCSKGTYIRSIVRDFGLKCESGAYLKSLRRTKIGEYSVDMAMNITAFEEEKYETL
jgi:tRNA pseudouridine55 synthase